MNILVTYGYGISSQSLYSPVKALLMKEILSYQHQTEEYEHSFNYNK
jgi:hypothetical protein